MQANNTRQPRRAFTLIELPAERKGFTLIELLVVVAIIVSLIAILLPSLGKAKDTAVQVTCASQARQIAAATFLYADSNKGLLPSRPGGGSDRPHRVRGTKYNLNKTFIEPYLGNRDEMMFCPSRLREARNAQTLVPADYGEYFVTYQYHAYEKDTGWRIEMPDLSHMSGVRRNYALWTCLTIHDISAGIYFGHDTPVIGRAPEGFNSAHTDGSARWYGWDQRQAYWQVGSQYYVWPRTE